MRNALNFTARRWQFSPGLACDPLTDQTQQQFKDESDINTIVKRFGLTGQLPDGLAVPQSGDFTQVYDFQSAMNVVRQAQEAFMECPADLRARFHNDPGEFLDFVNNDENRPEAEKLGLLARKPEKTRDVVTAVDELAAKLVVPASGKT